MAIIKAQQLYSAVEQNAEISASSSEDFAVDNTAQANKLKYGSMNSLLLVNRSSQAIAVYLDGTKFAEMSAGQTLTMNAEDGIFFNLIRVTNLSADTAITASTITIRYSRLLITGVM